MLRIAKTKLHNDCVVSETSKLFMFRRNSVTPIHTDRVIRVNKYRLLIPFILFTANVANHRKAKVVFGLCKMERSGIHKPNNAFDCPSEFALLCVSWLECFELQLFHNLEMFYVAGNKCHIIFNCCGCNNGITGSHI